MSWSASDNGLLFPHSLALQRSQFLSYPMLTGGSVVSKYQLYYHQQNMKIPLSSQLRVFVFLNFCPSHRWKLASQCSFTQISIISECDYLIKCLREIFIAFCENYLSMSFTCFLFDLLLLYLYMRYISLLSMIYNPYFLQVLYFFWLCGLVGVFCRAKVLLKIFINSSLPIFPFLAPGFWVIKNLFTRVTEEFIHVSFLYSCSFIIYIKIFGSFAIYFSVWYEVWI